MAEREARDPRTSALCATAGQASNPGPAECFYEDRLEWLPEWVDEHGVAKRITVDDILIVSPYNAQVGRLQDALARRSVDGGPVPMHSRREPTPLRTRLPVTSADAAGKRALPISGDGWPVRPKGPLDRLRTARWLAFFQGHESSGRGPTVTNHVPTPLRIAQ